MELTKIEIITDGGPWADHNMPCAVCWTEHAVLDMHTSRFEPCWKCQAKRWRTLKIPQMLLWLLERW